MDDRLLSTAETAEILGCSTRSVFRLIAEKRLRPVRLNKPHGKLKIEPEEIRRLIERAREGQAA